jgi:hypothetical protein
MSTHHFELFADYNQFYLQDESAEGDLSEAWTPEAVARWLAVGPGVIGVGTARNMPVPVTVKVLEEEPEEVMGDWDQVTEASLSIRSSRLVVAGCTEYFPDAARISLPPGDYRVRVFYGDLRVGIRRWTRWKRSLPRCPVAHQRGPGAADPQTPLT